MNGNNLAIGNRHLDGCLFPVTMLFLLKGSTMKRPRDLRVYNRETYWNRVDKASIKMREQNNGLLASWVFDFVSIHANCFDGTFGLCSPLCLQSKNGERPFWHMFRFATKQAAIDFAKWVARQSNVFIVDCV